jgi:diaminopimelate decarboxylase
MKTLLAAAAIAAAFAMPAQAGSASKNEIDKCWQVVADAQDFIAAAPATYSAENAVALEDCIKIINADTKLGKRLRALNDYNESRPLGGE